MVDLSDSEQIKNLLRTAGFKPKDYLGQNFLVDKAALHAIVAAADLKSTDVVLEVGPGLGVLTSELIKYAKQVYAIEKDFNLVAFLKKQFKSIPNLNIINEDILKFHVEKFIQGDYKVVANIPYYLTSKLFQIFLEREHQPKLLVLMVQKEVGERVVAAPGELSILGISVQIYADVEIATVKIPDQVRDGFGEKTPPLIIPKTSFWPMPKVDSVILRIEPKNKYPEIEDKKLFFRIIKTAFAGKRKQIKNTITDVQALQKAGIDPTLRPQDLSIEDWIRLYQVFDKFL